MIVKVADRQNIFDVALQYFGSLDFVAKIIMDNDLAWSAEIKPGQELEINAQGLGSEKIKQYFELNKITVINGAKRAKDLTRPTWDSTLIKWDSTDVTFDAQ